MRHLLALLIALGCVYPALADTTAGNGSSPCGAYSFTAGNRGVAEGSTTAGCGWFTTNIGVAPGTLTTTAKGSGGPGSIYIGDPTLQGNPGLFSPYSCVSCNTAAEVISATAGIWNLQSNAITAPVRINAPDPLGLGSTCTDQDSSHDAGGGTPTSFGDVLFSYCAISVFDFVSTTLSANITTGGSQSVTVASCAHILSSTNQDLVVGAGTANVEVVNATGCSAGSLTATFLNTHSSGDKVQSFSGWARCNNQNACQEFKLWHPGDSLQQLANSPTFFFPGNFSEPNGARIDSHTTLIQGQTQASKWAQTEDSYMILHMVSATDGYFDIACPNGQTCTAHTVNTACSSQLNFCFDPFTGTNEANLLSGTPDLRNATNCATCMNNGQVMWSSRPHSDAVAEFGEVNNAAACGSGQSCHITFNYFNGASSNPCTSNTWTGTGVAATDIPLMIAALNGAASCTSQGYHYRIDQNPKSTYPAGDAVTVLHQGADVWLDTVVSAVTSVGTGLSVGATLDDTGTQGYNILGTVSKISGGFIYSVFTPDFVGPTATDTTGGVTGRGKEVMIMRSSGVLGGGNGTTLPDGLTWTDAAGNNSTGTLNPCRVTTATAGCLNTDIPRRWGSGSVGTGANVGQTTTIAGCTTMALCATAGNAYALPAPAIGNGYGTGSGAFIAQPFVYDWYEASDGALGNIGNAGIVNATLSSCSPDASCNVAAQETVTPSSMTGINDIGQILDIDCNSLPNAACEPVRITAINLSGGTFTATFTKAHSTSSTVKAGKYPLGSAGAYVDNIDAANDLLVAWPCVNEAGASGVYDRNVCAEQLNISSGTVSNFSIVFPNSTGDANKVSFCMWVGPISFRAYMIIVAGSGNSFGSGTSSPGLYTATANPPYTSWTTNFVQSFGASGASSAPAAVCRIHEDDEHAGIMTIGPGYTDGSTTVNGFWGFGA